MEDDNIILSVQRHLLPKHVAIIEKVPVVCYANLGISIGDEKLHLMAQQLPSQTKMMFGFSDSRFAFT